MDGFDLSTLNLNDRILAWRLRLAVNQCSATHISGMNGLIGGSLVRGLARHRFRRQSQRNEKSPGHAGKWFEDTS